ncbi:MerR family transcriptional regulator [Enterococcus rivorum]|uniref:MerR family transcriptional regulator n=1 Tax=Enterococcus rivorum TaxID=762845 RepID=UPI00363CFC12
MFKIGEFSKVSNITVRTLRHYEKVGLLLPSKVDQQSGYRYYKAEQLGVLNQIKLLQQVGLSLESIKEILRSQDLSVLNYYYELREQEIHLELETLNAKKQLVEELKKQLKEGVSMEKYNVVKKQLAVRNVMSIRKVIPSFSDEGQLWNKLYLEAQKQQVNFQTNHQALAFIMTKNTKRLTLTLKCKVK